MKHLLLCIFLIITGCTTNIYNSTPMVANHNVEAAYRSVALLNIKSPSGKEVSASGFGYDKDRILTAGHFCISALEIQIFESHKENITMEYYDEDYEKVKKINVVVDDFSRIQDICILKKENHGLRPLPIVEDYKKIKIRDIVIIVGNPLGIVLGEFEGRVMSLFYDGGPRTVTNMLVISSASTGGISGSPVILNRTGEVIGILVRGHIFFDHLSFAVNGKDLNTFIKGLK